MKKGKKIILLIALVNVLVCFLLFSSATWSWLSEGIGTDSNVINSSQFAFDVEVKQGDQIISVENNNQYGYHFNFESKGKYTITIRIADTSTASNGYCKIVAKDENLLIRNYYKNVICRGEVNSVLTFEIETFADGMEFTFIPSIGIASTNSFSDNEGYLAIDFGNN